MAKPSGSTGSEVNKIQTFVFFDLEATSLPMNSPRILELSMIAVSRDSLISMNKGTTIEDKRSSSPDLFASQPGSSTSTQDNPVNIGPFISQPTTKCSSNGRSTPKKWSPPPSPTRGNYVPKLPRILHKYTRLYYPWKVITIKAEEITGLSNDMLQHLKGFSKDSAQAISLFLNLPKPVAIVAHNGSNFDFKLIKAELLNVESEEGFSDLLCIDTLKAIKAIDTQHEKEDIQQITMLAESFSMEDMFDDFMEDSPTPSCKRTRPEAAVEMRASGSERSMESSPQPHRPLKVSCQLPITPMKEQGLKPSTNAATPQKPSFPQPSPYTPEFSKTPGYKSHAARETSKVRRNLTYEGPGKRKFKAILPYKQVDIYHRLFDTDYAAHRAESDCQALLEICGHYGESFAKWSDTFSESFAEVKPMWVKRKSFATFYNLS